LTAVLILLDAFRHDYLTREHCPFLWDCAQNGEHYARVVPSFGFCERSEILSGLKPDESGFFTAIGFDPIDSPFRRFKYLSFLEPFFPHAYRRFIRKFANGMSIYEIPSHLLGYWNLTEDKIDHRMKGAFPSGTILSLIKDSGRDYFYDSFTALNLPHNGTDQDRMRLALENAGDSRYALYLIYVSAPDMLGHQYGPLSEELLRGISEMDTELKSFTENFRRIRPETKFVFLGDHGMAPVTCNVDVERQLMLLGQRHALKLKRDYIYFLDSTMLRVWFFSKYGRKVLFSALKSLPVLVDNGLFVDKTLANSYNIPWNDRRYGDLIWLANDGVLIFPDFFHRNRPYKGMHGYDQSLSDSQGMCIIFGSDVAKKITKSITLTDIFHILKGVLWL